MALEQSVREMARTRELGSWGEGRGHVATGKRAGMVGWMGGIGARAWGGSDARNGVMARVGAEAAASQRTWNGEHEQVVKPPREVADALFFNLKRVDEKAIRH